MEITDKNVFKVARALEVYYRKKFAIPDGPNLRVKQTGHATNISQLNIEYYDHLVPGETDIYEVKSIKEEVVIEVPTRQQISVVNLINYNLDLIVSDSHLMRRREN